MPWLRCRFVLLLVLATVFLPSHVFAAYGTQSSPKLLNLFLDHEIKAEDPAKLAKWDIVVLDMDQQFQSPEKLREIRRLNPRIKLLAYVSASEIADARFTQHPLSPGYKLASSIPDHWFLHRADGSRASWWPNTSLLNATDLGPMEKGLRWNTFLGSFIRNELLASGLWDGVFLDGAYSDVTSHFGLNLDPDDDGGPNEPKQNDEAWRQGMQTLILNVHAAIGSDKLILANSGGAAYAPLVNGILYENFGQYGWVYPFTEYRAASAQTLAPSISALNVNTQNIENPADYRLMRYGLASAMMGDGYFSFDAGDRGHHRTWWYDEYDIALGHPVSTAVSLRSDVWQREYEQGLVLVNASSQPIEVDVGGEYERLLGLQDPLTNDGALVARVSVPPQDGLMLRRSVDAKDVRGAVYANGAFLEVYATDGNLPRSGFFASHADVPEGSDMLSADLDRDGLDDVVFIDAAEVHIKFGNGTRTRFRPFRESYQGGFSFAVGQTDEDGDLELVFVPTEGQAQVLVTDIQGKALSSWLAYPKEYEDGAQVAVGDLDGDGVAEIVTAPNDNASFSVRTFQQDGTLWAPGFFVGERDGNGLRLAAGDVDGDGRAEIVAKTEGIASRVRVLDGRGNVKNEFSVMGATSVSGLAVSDIDHDGKDEILMVAP